jgi:hypothetical protein
MTPFVDQNTPIQYSVVSHCVVSSYYFLIVARGFPGCTIWYTTVATVTDQWCPVSHCRYAALSGARAVLSVFVRVKRRTCRMPDGCRLPNHRLPSANLPPAICHRLKSAICLTCHLHDLPACFLTMLLLYLLPSPSRHCHLLPSAVYRLPSAVCRRLQSTIVAALACSRYWQMPCCLLHLPPPSATIASCILIIIVARGSLKLWADSASTAASASSSSR